ncbi:creatininase family protein [Ramlibacter sp. G-1-2-2]|uniref:Creatininase family protein n=1 Tax=Ramlibacter agri TaxID=2728837 RepID=A0A848HAK7_9BURK|nr:creatininase family protein [Ramlibacter agri]NML46539.1 creatininase family protein [Ramlibacter agri]
MVRIFRSRLLQKAAGATLLWAALAAHAAVPAVVDIEQLTSPELKARIAAGTTIVLVPIGGTEQSGPHIVLGKHNVRAHALAGEIARRLGNAVVAPVVAYVPEGSINPPAAHMRFTGTLSIPDATFESLLEATARSFKQHGFHDVFFLGDHGGYQKSEQKVADKLNREWKNDPSCRVHALLDYYDVTQGAFIDTLKKKGYSPAEIGTHAGLNDTALSLAVDKSLVRADVLAKGADLDVAHGVHGDPRRATAEIGELGVKEIVDTSVASIQRAVAAKR